MKGFFLIGATLVLASLARAAELETYRPDLPGGEKISYLTSETDGKGHYALVTNFGIEEAGRARKLGRLIAHAGYPREQAVSEILRIAAETYPESEFFTRCFARQAVLAYLDATSKPANPFRFLC